MVDGLEFALKRLKGLHIQGILSAAQLEYQQQQLNMLFASDDARTESVIGAGASSTGVLDMCAVAITGVLLGICLTFASARLR